MNNIVDIVNAGIAKSLRDSDPNKEVICAAVDGFAKIISTYISTNSVANIEEVQDVMKNVADEIVNFVSKSNSIAHDSRSSSVTKTNTTSSIDQKITKDLVDNTVFDDYIVCLEDGVKRKMLKRYLKAKYNMTPEEYKRKWNLPYDYPMTAPNHAQVRSTIAKSMKLGL